MGRPKWADQEDDGDVLGPWRMKIPRGTGTAQAPGAATPQPPWQQRVNALAEHNSRGWGGPPQPPKPQPWLRQSANGSGDPLQSGSTAWYCAACGLPHGNAQAKKCRRCNAPNPFFLRKIAKPQDDKKVQKPEAEHVPFPKMPPHLTKFAQKVNTQESGDTEMDDESEAPQKEASSNEAVQLAKAEIALRAAGYTAKADEIKKEREKIETAVDAWNPRKVNVAYQQAVRRREKLTKQMETQEALREDLQGQLDKLAAETAETRLELDKAEALVAAAHRALAPTQKNETEVQAAPGSRQSALAFIDQLPKLPVPDADTLNREFAKLQDSAQKGEGQAPDRMQFIWHKVLTHIGESFTAKLVGDSQNAASDKGPPVQSTPVQHQVIEGTGAQASGTSRLARSDRERSPRRRKEDTDDELGEGVRGGGS